LPSQGHKEKEKKQKHDFREKNTETSLIKKCRPSQSVLNTCDSFQGDQTVGRVFMVLPDSEENTQSPADMFEERGTLRFLGNGVWSV
jgi:hypothetical protein